MKQTILFFFLLLASSFGWTQNIDSFFAEPQIIELGISTPQPRMQETFQITLDVSHLRANIFRSAIGKVEVSNDVMISDDRELVMNVKPLVIGRSVIGPLEFFLDKTKYTTNKIIYDVVEALPNVDKGLWFRRVMTSDTTFCIIIEQRIPAVNKTVVGDNGSISFISEPESNDIAGFKDTYSVKGLSGVRSRSASNYGHTFIDGEQKNFLYGYSVYFFNIDDRDSKIVITKDKFKNLPNWYKFQDIIIQ